MCFDSDYINAKELSFKDNKAELQKWLPAVLACALVTLIALIYLIIITGRRDEEGKRPVYKIDRIYTEISLLIIVLVFIFGGMSFGPLLFEGINFGIYYGGILYNGS